MNELLLEGERDPKLEYWDPADEDEEEYNDLIQLEPKRVYRCRGILVHKWLCCVEIEWDGAGPMPKEQRFCRRCAAGVWDPRQQFPREIALA